MMVATGLLFERGVLTPVTLTLCWTSIFFVASCAASSAYLTVSEIFPLEMRGVAISIFYALGTLLGGVPAPLIFGRLIDTGSLHKLFGGLVLAAGLMAVAAVAEAIWGVAAEGKSLEEITAPTSRS
jgi:MFS family permease